MLNDALKYLVTSTTDAISRNSIITKNITEDVTIIICNTTILNLKGLFYAADTVLKEQFESSPYCLRK